MEVEEEMQKQHEEMCQEQLNVSPKEEQPEKQELIMETTTDSTEDIHKDELPAEDMESMDELAHPMQDEKPIFAKGPLVFYEGDEVLTTELTFKYNEQPENPDFSKTSIFVDNIPREATDAEICEYFEQFGNLIYMERIMCKSFHQEVVSGHTCHFEKNAFLMYCDKESVERATRLFSHPFKDTKLVVMKKNTSLVYDPRKTIVIEKLLTSFTYDDIRDAFKHVGEVIWLNRRNVRSMAVAVVFRNEIDIEKAVEVKKIFSEDIQVHPLPVDKEWFREYQKKFTIKANDISSFKSNHPAIIAKKKRIAALKLMTHEAIMRTKLDSNYVVPDPDKYSYEVKIYNSPKNITLTDLNDYFKNYAEVTNFRFIVPQYSNTWLVFASFKNLSSAKKACRATSTFKGNNIFMIMACEEVVYDPESTLYLRSAGALTVQQIYDGLKKGGGKIDFIMNEDKNKAVIVIVDPKHLKNATNKKRIAGSAVQIHPYNDILHADQSTKSLSMDEMIELQKKNLQQLLDKKRKRQKMTKEENIQNYIEIRKLKKAILLAELQKGQEVERQNETEKMRDKRLSYRERTGGRRKGMMSLNEAVNMQLQRGFDPERDFNNVPSFGRFNDRGSRFQFNKHPVRNRMNSGSMFDNYNYNAQMMSQEYNPMRGNFNMYDRNQQAYEYDDRTDNRRWASTSNQYEDRTNYGSSSSSDQLARELREKDEIINRLAVALVASNGYSGEGIQSSDNGGRKYRVRPNISDNTLCVANLAPEVKRRDIETLFKKYGRIIRCDVTPIDRGCRQAYIEYSKVEEAKKACVMNQVMYNNRRLRVSLSTNKLKNKEGFTTFVEWTKTEQVIDEDLYTTFKQYGEINFVRVNRSKSGSFGTVTFKEIGPCDIAINCTELANGIQVKCRKYTDVF